MFARWWDNLRESCDIRLAAGCGCAMAWVLLVAVSPVLSASSSFMGTGLTWRLCIVAAAAAAFAAGALGTRAHGPQGSRDAAPSVPLLAAAAACSPTGALIHSGSGDTATVISGILVGAGLAGLTLGWAAPFAAVRLRKRVVGTVAAVFAGGVLYLAIAALPAPFAHAAALALAPASLFLAMLLGRFPNGPEAEGEERGTAGEDAAAGEGPVGAAARAREGTGAPERRAARRQPSFARMFGPELSLAAAIYGALFVLAGHVLPEIEHAWMASAVPGLLNVALFLAVEAVLTVYMVRRIRHESPSAAYRPATILVAVGFLLLPFAGTEGALVCMAVSFSGFGCFLVYLWIVMGNMAHRWGASPCGLTAYGFALLFAGIIAGEVAAWALFGLRPAEFSYVATVSIVALFLLVVLMWAMADGARYANETAEMGGVPLAPDAGPFPAGASTDPGAAGDAGADPLAAKLTAAAASYGLSPREVEVAALLLRGRSIPYICDELFIAKSTAQTHVRHIYAKMEITGGRQELIDRIEGEGVEA